MAEGKVQRAVKRRSGVVVPQKLKWHGEAAACAIWLAGNLLSRTWRMKVEDQVARELTKDGCAIVALWHNRLAIAMPVWKHWKRDYPETRLAALISASKDGALLARTFSYFGIQPIRGSSSRRGAQALLELTTALRSRTNVAITPDGPRGPKYQVQPGIISLAQVTGAPIIPLGAHISRKKELRSWDRFQVPLPFSRCSVVMGAPIKVAREATEQEHEAARLALQNALMSLNRD